MKKTELLACAVGIAVGAGAVWFLLSQNNLHFHSNTHPIANPADDEYHVHADFHIIVHDKLIDLSTDNYMTTATQELHPDAHLHDGEGGVKHIHAEGITFVEFLESLDITVTNECITYDEDTFCADSENVLTLYVENEPYEGNITEYAPVDDERILLYYGTRENADLETYLEAVPDDSCYYSGTCPERGTAPPESCGLTCEL